MIGLLMRTQQRRIIRPATEAVSLSAKRSPLTAYPHLWLKNGNFVTYQACMTSMNFHQLPMRHFASRKGTKEVELPPEEEAPKVKRGRGRPRKETPAEAEKDEAPSGT